MELPIKIFGTDKQVRDILYVKDAVEAFDCFYEFQAPGIYNIGGGIGNAISLRQCLDQLKRFNKIKQNIILEPARTGDLWYFVCDTTKAKNNLKWASRTTNHKGLWDLTNWVKENRDLFE